eukprot:Opistho-2@62467
MLLLLGHAVAVVLERGELVARLARSIAEELGDLRSVLRVLVDAQLEVLGEVLVKLLVVLLVFGDLLEHFNALLDEVLADDLENLALLEHLTRNVEGEILAVDDTLDKLEVVGNELLAVVHDKHAAHVQLDVVRLLLLLKEVEGGALWDKEQRLELELTLDRKVLHGEMVLPVVRERLVERRILLRRNLIRVACPDGLRLVELLKLGRLLLDLLRLLVLALLVVLNLLNLALLLLLILVLLLVADVLLRLLDDLKLDRVANELRVLFHDLLDLLLLGVLELVLLHLKDEHRAAAETGSLGVDLDGEAATGRRLPDILLVVIVLRDDLDAVRNEVGRVETDTKLTNHRNVCAGLECLHKRLGARLSDRSEVVDEVSLGHTDASVADDETLVLLVGDDRDLKVLARVKLRGVREALIADLVEGVRCVRDELTKENLLVAVERVDDEAHKLSNLGLEGEGLGFGRHFQGLKA